MLPGPGARQEHTATRDSWEGRLGPASGTGTEHGVRDSWMPPGATDAQRQLKLEQLR